MMNGRNWDNEILLLRRNVFVSEAISSQSLVFIDLFYYLNLCLIGI